MFAREHKRNLEALVVLGHGGEVQILGSLRARGFFKGRIGQGHGHFAAAVGAVIEEDASVVVADQTNGLLVRLDDGYRLDELIGDAVLVGSLHGRHWIVGLFAVAEHHGVEGALHAIPTLIAIHGVVAARDRGDFARRRSAAFLSVSAR